MIDRAIWLRIAHVLALYSAIVLGASGVWYYLSAGWSWKSTAFGAAAIAMTFAAVWLRDKEIELAVERIMQAVADHLHEHAEKLQGGRKVDG
jgi:hypothetical protein